MTNTEPMADVVGRALKVLGRPGAYDGRVWDAHVMLSLALSRPAPEASGDVVEAVRAFAESFHFTVTDSHYSDAYLTINEPDAVHFRLGSGSQFSKFIAALEKRRQSALSATTPQGDAWRPIETAPKDGSEFLSVGPDAPEKVQPTRWLSPGPYSTENGKNAEGERRYQWPDGFYWAGYDGFVGPVRITQWRPFPAPPLTESQTDAD